MIEQLILFGNVHGFDVAAFTIQMSRLSSFLQALQRASVPLPDLKIVFFSPAIEARSNPSLILAPISQPPQTSIPNSPGKKYLLLPFVPNRNVFSPSTKPKLANRPF